ncbi:MAG: hypothetical protein KAG28_09935 [Cocleimonas sp.]|nr:hypothetical protein [Cocleimonas sp.]
MKLKVVVEGHAQPIHIPDELMKQASEYFDMMDQDMDNGYQMSHNWIENPDTFQRCQIAADKMLTALQTQNESTYTLMAAYILARMPETELVSLSQSGDMSEHDIDHMDMGLF